MKKLKSGRGVLWLTALLFLLLLVLTTATILVIQRSSSLQSRVPFDLNRITAQQNTDDIDISDLLQPAFIGITVDDTRSGISVSSNTVAELYRALLPILSEVLENGSVSNSDHRTWSALPDEANSVYVRYHYEMPDYLLRTLYSGSAQTNTAYVYEMFLFPYSEITDSITIAARSLNGSVTVYECHSPEEVFTSEDLRKLLLSYRSNLTTFDFHGEDSAFSSSTEPVFQDSVSTRSILVTGQTATLLQNSEQDTDTLLRLFELNPDKLLNTHIEADGTGSYIDRQGILYLGTSTFEYSAVQDGGIPISAYLDPSTEAELSDYLATSSILFDRIRSVNRHYAGGDADITLASVTSFEDTVTITYEYTFDNIRITGIEPAFTVTFEDGVLLSAKLFTMSVRNLGDRTESLAEWWFVDYLKRQNCSLQNVTLVYRSDFLSESIRAEWCGESLSK